MLFPVGVQRKGSEWLQNIVQAAAVRHTNLANVRGLEDRPWISLVSRSLLIKSTC